MGNTSIEWTDKTWSPLQVRVRHDAAEIAKAKGYASLVQIAERTAGSFGQHCEHVSPGCENCYSGTFQKRCLPANGTGLPFDRRSRDLIEPFVNERVLTEPPKWRKPQRIFVMNQSDLFGEWYTDKAIDRVFAVMALCPQHTFQVLTKRPERMSKYLSDRDLQDRLTDLYDKDGWQVMLPLPNVWLGVSVENQAMADARIPLLLQTPAAARFVSYEPALGPMSFRWAAWDNYEPHPRRVTQIPDVPRGGRVLAGSVDHLDGLRMLDWVIIGGESGLGARPFDLAWARSIIAQCKAAGVSVFFKQAGAKPINTDYEYWGHKMRIGDGNAEYNKYIRLKLKSRKGGDMAEWPEDMRVREFPR